MVDSDRRQARSGSTNWHRRGYALVLLLAVVAVALFISRLGGVEPAGEESLSPATSDNSMNSGDAPRQDPDGAGDAPAPQGAVPTTPPPAPAGDEEDAVDYLVSTIYAVTPPLLVGDPVDLSQIATGTVLSSLEAMAVEFEHNGWSQEGSAVVASWEIVDEEMDADPPTMTIEVCVDSSDVRIVDDAGQQLRTPDAPQRSLNIYTAVKEAGQWRLSGHTFPDDPDC